MNRKQRALTLGSLLVATALLASSTNAMMMMPMYFWKGEELYWLSRYIESTDSGEYAAGLIVTFLLGLVL